MITPRDLLNGNATIRTFLAALVDVGLRRSFLIDLILPLFVVLRACTTMMKGNSMRDAALSLALVTGDDRCSIFFFMGLARVAVSCNTVDKVLDGICSGHKDFSFISGTHFSSRVA